MNLPGQNSERWQKLFFAQLSLNNGQLTAFFQIPAVHYPEAVEVAVFALPKHLYKFPFQLLVSNRALPAFRQQAKR